MNSIIVLGEVRKQSQYVQNRRYYFTAHTQVLSISTTLFIVSTGPSLNSGNHLRVKAINILLILLAKVSFTFDISFSSPRPLSYLRSSYLIQAIKTVSLLQFR